MPFDSVVIRTPDQARRLSIGAFLDLPLNQRIAVILRREIEFFLGATPIDRKVALSSLRVQKAS